MPADQLEAKDDGIQMQPHLAESDSHALFRSATGWLPLRNEDTHRLHGSTDSTTVSD